jgi:hypothetical protein
MKTYGEYRYSTKILDLGTRWKWVVSFTPRPLHPWGKSPNYPLERRLGVPQSRSGRCGVKKNHFSLPGTELRWSSLSLYRLGYKNLKFNNVHYLIYKILPLVSEPDESSLHPHSISLTYIVTLSCHLFLGLPCVLVD